MVAFVKINDFVENLAKGVHDFTSDATSSLTIALSNTAPASETSNPTADTNGVLANVTEIAYTNLSTRVCTISASALSSGTYTLTLNDLTLTASGAVATFRYVYVYDDDPTSPADPLVAHFDYGSALTMANGDTFTIDFGADAGTTGALFTLA